MVKVETSVVINRSVEEVFAFLSLYERSPQWQSYSVEMKQTSEGPVGVGTTWTEVSQFLGRRIESTLEATVYQLNRKFGIKVSSGPMPGKGEYAFESVEGGTKVTFFAEGKTRGFFKIAEPIVEREFKREWEGNLANLKDLLEAGA